jgi:PAS domain S-box-containing protein
MPDWKWSLRPTFEGLVRTVQEMACGIIVEDEDAKILYVNQRILEWSGHLVEDLEGRSVNILVPPELHTFMPAERRSVFDGDRRTRLSAFMRKDGRTFPVAVTPSAMKRVDDGQLAIISLVVDLGEVQTAKPIGVEDGSLAAELSVIALRLQSMSFVAAVSIEATTSGVDHPMLADLSPRERETLERLMSGLRVAAIAKEFCISPHTVRNHLKSIYRKLDVSSQSELIELVRGLGKGEQQDSDKQLSVTSRRD